MAVFIEYLIGFYESREIQFILAISLFALLQYFVAFVAVSTKRRHDKRRAIDILQNEIEDLIRHCESNIEVLDKIISEKRIPYEFHIKRMMFPAELITARTTALTSATRKTIQKVSSISIINRNTNDLIDECVALYHLEKQKKSLIIERVSMIRHRMEYVRSRLMYDSIVLKSQEEGRLQSDKTIIYYND